MGEGLLLLVVIGLSGLFVAAALKGSPAPTRHLRIVFPRDLTPEAVVAFVRGLAGLLPPRWKRFGRLPMVVFHAVGEHEGISHYLSVSTGSADFVLTQLRGLIPGVRISEADDALRREWTLAGELRLSHRRIPLRTDLPESTATAFLAAFQPLERGERITFQLAVTPTTGGAFAVDPARALSGSSWIGELMGAIVGATGDTAKPDARLVKAVREKFSEPVFLVAVRVGAAAASRSRARQLMARILGVFHIMNAPGVNLRRRLIPDSWSTRRLEQVVAPTPSAPLLNAKELACLLAWPLGDPALPGLQLGSARQLPPSPIIPSTGRVLAASNFPGSPRPLAISPADSLRHIHLIGPTGTGKSTLLLNLIVGDMQSGAGVIVLDPKGDLVVDVLDRVPVERERDVIWLDPADTERPVALNPLEGAERDPELVTDQIVGVFHKLYAAFWGPRTDDILRAAVRTLVQVPGMTLCEVPQILTDEGFRRSLVGKLDDPVALGPFWSWYEGMSVAERAQAIGPVMNKLRAFLIRQRIRNVIGQAEPTFSMEGVLRDRKILLVSLAKGLLGEESSALMGSLVMARLWQATQQRAALPALQRPTVFAHIDEFQDYLNLPTSLADLLAQARGFGLGLTLAHQHLGQLPPPIRQAVLANARSRVVFQTAAADAAVLAKEFAPRLSADDLRGLAAYEVALLISAGSTVAPAVTGVTLPPPPEIGRGGSVRALSRERFGRDRAAVEGAIRARQSSPPSVSGDFRRRRT